MNDNRHRLPRTVIPNGYRLRLEPDLESFVFTGTERIAVEVTTPVDRITLNAVDLEIVAASLSVGTTVIPVTEIIYDEEMQRATFELGRSAPVGPASLDLEFTGVLNDQLHGFYRSIFTDVNGVEQVIATTQFEATDARRAFPCFDEPDLKATFSITLVVPDQLLAVSNGAEIDRQVAGPGRVAVSFAETMRMSTYIVACAIGPFEATEPVDVDGVPLRVIAPVGKEHLAAFALECGEFSLRYLSHYYEIPYPGDKVDLVAIPDFAFGAMENLGCITFRESALLVDPSTATQAELVRILDVVAHELAHMWFGDLVTMGWWDGIWLNEAFATFMEMKASDAMRPEWQRWQSFGAVERPWAFGVDSLATTRPVEFEVGSPEEANEMFDALTYGKGSSVLRMIEQYLGEEVFRQGVGNYLRRHAHANTVTADLWAALDEASGLAVGEIMDTWILQGGFPQLEVDQTEGGIRLTQRRFLSIPDETDQTLWRIPVQIRGTSDGTPFENKMVLSAPSEQLSIEGPIELVVANAGGHGFYRVVYDQAYTKALIGSLESREPLERFILIDDAWAFVESGQSTASQYLELAAAYREETEQSIWQAVLGGLAAVRHHLVEPRDLEPYAAVVSDLLAPAYARLGWDPGPEDSDLTRRLRGMVLGGLGRLAEDAEVINRAEQVADSWLDDPHSADPDVAQAALFIATSRGDLGLFDRLFVAQQKTVNPQSELKLLQALTCFDRVEAVDRILAAVLDGSIRSQDAAWVTARLFGGYRSGEEAWQRVRADWSALTAKLPPATVRRLIEGIPALSRPEVAADVEAFFAETQLPVATRTITQNLERLRSNRLLRSRETEPLSRWLRGMG